MSDQESNESVETHISQPQRLANNFMVGTASEESEPSSSKRKSDFICEKENAVDAKKRCEGLLDEREEDFQASGVKLSLHGLAYQWKLLMLFALNSYQLGYDFDLATEMNAAEKFDDVVLQYWKAGTDVKHWRFLQAKHFQTESDSKTITAKDLLKKKDGKFSLQKYFLSFQKIKRNRLFQSGQLQDFIICTNSDFDFDNGFQHQSLKKLCHKEALYLELVTEADEMLNVGGERYRFVSSSHPERQAVVSMLKSIFDETSECRKLAKMLAEHLLEGKTIPLRGLFKDYHMPLTSCVFNIRDKKLAKKFVEGKLDDQSCPRALAFREALHEAIIERLKEQPEKQNKLLHKGKKLTRYLTDSDTLWNDIGKLELKFSASFRRPLIPNSGLKELPELQVTDEEVEEFLDRLIFAVNQPNEKRLSELMSDKLGQELKLNDGDLIINDFERRMIEWLKEKKGHYQSQETVRNFFCNLQEKVCKLILRGPTSQLVEALDKYEIEFDDNVLAALKRLLEEETSVFNYITDPKQTFLGSLKVNQVMKDISAYEVQGSFIFVSLKNLLLLEEKALMAFREEQSKLLIVECEEEPTVQMKELFSKLSEIIKEKHGKKVILIAPHNHPLACQFKTGEPKTLYHEMADEFKFGDLTSESQEKLLKKTVKFQGIEIALNELISADSAITKMLPLASLIEGKKLEIGQPVPVSIGYDEGFYIGRTLNYQSDENPASYSTENLDKLMQQAQRQKVMLISDIAGMGKSTLLTHLSKQIKQKCPSVWVFRIDLNDHTDALEVQSKHKIEAVEFLSQWLLKLNSPFEKELFEQRLKEGKVVVMLDGFDEISPYYKTTVIDLLQALKEMSVQQLWVTTRPHLRKILEKNLQQHCYTLEPFTKGNQVEFLTKFWNQKLNLQGTSQQQLEMYATALIEKLEQSINDRDKKFTSVPLQTRLLAEAFDQSAVSGQNLPHKLDLPCLYRSFTERKYDIYCEHKMKTTKSNVATKERRKRDFRTFRKEHQHLAFQMLFPKKEIGIFKGYSQPASGDQYLARYGIVHYIGDKPRFIHRTFAEYFVADILMDQLSKDTTLRQEKLDFFLKDILLKENYQVIVSFLDEFLENWKPSKGILKQSGKRIREVWKDDTDGDIGQKLLRSLGRTILHQAAQGGHSYIIGYLLDSLKAGEHLETICDIILAKDRMGQTAWHLSVENGQLNTLEELWDWAKEAKLNLKDDILLAEDNNGQTACHLAAWNKHPQVLKKLLECAEEAELSQQELKKLLLANDMEGKTVWHLAAWENKREVFQNLMEWAEKANLDQHEFKKLLLQKSYRGQTPWHFATLNNHPEVYEWVTKVIKDPQEQKELLKKLFFDKDKDEQTIWHLAAQSIHLDVFKMLLDVADKALSKEELLSLLQTKDTKGRTAWHLSAENGREESLNTLWEWAKKVHLNENELKNNWLLSQDSMGSAWHLAAHRGHITVLKKLWDWAREMNLNLKEDLLLFRDVSGRNAGHLAAEKLNTETLEKLLHWAKEANLNFAADLLLTRDRNGQTPLALLKDSFYNTKYYNTNTPAMTFLPP